MLTHQAERWALITFADTIFGIRIPCFGLSSVYRLHADAHVCDSAVMANAKSFFPEDHPNFIGTYWGQARRIILL